MIVQEGGKWKAECDGYCGTVCFTGQKSFQQAVNYLSRAEDWDNRKVQGTWRNYCPRCAGVGDPDLELAGIGFGKKHDDDDE